MSLVVQKFGGTSVGSIERIRKVAQIVLQAVNLGEKVVVVVSAMAGVTNSLINNCGALSRLDLAESLREYDAIISTGEVVSTGLLALELQNIGLKATSLQGWQIPIITDNIYGNATVQSINAKRILELVQQGVVPVITGFQGMTIDGDPTTLGKGGSDTTAALIGAAIGAERVDIYTDVKGIFTADPRIVHDARKIEVISGVQALVLGSCGAKVLHPRAALAAVRYEFDMNIISSFETDEGTLIKVEKPTTPTGALIDIDKKMENRVITAITSNKNLLDVSISYKLEHFSELLKDLGDNGLIIDKLDCSVLGKMTFIANLVERNKIELILQNLQHDGVIDSFNMEANISTVTIVGYSLKNDGGFCFRVLNLLAQNSINVRALEVNEISLTLSLEDDDTEKTIKLLHDLI